MQASLPQSRRLSYYTNTPFEIFIAAFTILPFSLLAYFYTSLPERVPLFMHLNGEVAVWGEKSWLSALRVPLMALVTQVFCLLMKYGIVQAEAALPAESEEDYVRLERQTIVLNAGLWDWFRCVVAFKMSAASLDTVFLSIERYKFLSKPTFIITLTAALFSIVGGIYYGYRLFVVKRRIRERFGVAKAQRPVDARRVYGGVFYFNPSDSSLFVNKYAFNFANKWAWVFIACLIAYPLLVFLPG